MLSYGTFFSLSQLIISSSLSRFGLSLTVEDLRAEGLSELMVSLIEPVEGFLVLTFEF